MAYVHKSRGTYDVCFSPCVAVREKAKQLVALLKDDRKLKEERAKAHTVRIGLLYWVLYIPLHYVHGILK